MADSKKNKTLLVTGPSSDEVKLVVAIVLNPESLDLEGMLSALVPELIRGGVRAGLLVVGDVTLVVRADSGQAMVDEADTGELLELAGIQDPWDPDTIVESFRTWIERLADNWADKVQGPLREILVPHVVAGLVGEVEVAEGIWGVSAHRLASQVD